MQVTGLEVTKILDIVSGVSAAGKDWQKMTFVGTTKEEYNNTYAFEIFGAEKIESFKQYTKVGSVIDVDFNVSCNEWKGKYYTSLSYWKSFKAGGSSESEPTPVEESSDTLPF